jgi:hypothetical protein
MFQEALAVDKHNQSIAFLIALVFRPTTTRRP